MDTFIWFSGSMSISQQLANGGLICNSGKESYAGNPSFSSGTKFDSDSVLEICMEVPYPECQVRDLTILYNTFLQSIQHKLHLIHRTLIVK